MKKLLSIIMLLGLLICSGTKVFADDATEAKDFFNKFITLTNSYSPEIPSLYSPNAKITRQVVKPDGQLVNASTNTETYMKQLKLGQATAKLRNYKNQYRNISVEKVANGYKVSAERQPSGETYWLKTYQVIQKQPNGSWIIVEELMQTKVQTFLKYADK